MGWIIVLIAGLVIAIIVLVFLLKRRTPSKITLDGITYSLH